MLTHDAIKDWTYSGTAPKPVYTYCIALESKSPDSDGWTTEHNLSLDFPVAVTQSQLKTMLTLMGWLKDYEIVGSFEIDEMEV